MLILVSHNDLDGYFSQWLVYESLKDSGFGDVEFLNINYNGIDDAIKEVSNNLKNAKGKNHKVVITDLNLSLKQCELVESYIGKYTSDFSLYDHHITGSESANKYLWYNLDTSKSASLIVYKEFTKHKYKSLKTLVNAINSADIFDKSNMTSFRAGRIINDLFLSIIRIPQICTYTKRKLIHILFDTLSNKKQDLCPVAISDKSGSILREVMHRYFSKKRLLSKYDISHLGTSKLTYQEMEYLLIVEELDVCLYDKGSSKLAVIYDLDRQLVTDVSDMILTYKFPSDEYVLAFVYEYHNEVIAVSLRSRGDMDVGKIAKSLGGGGHKNASAFSIPEWNLAHPIEETLLFAMP